MKHCALLLVIAFASIAVKASSAPALESTITVQQVRSERSDRASHVRICIDAEIRLVNRGDKPVILLKEAGHPHFKSGFALADSKENLLRPNALAFQYNGESVDTSSRWISLAKELDAATPDAGRFMFLMPDESKVYRQETCFDLPISDEDRSVADLESWEKVRSSAATWFQLLGDSWSENIDRAKTGLSEKLRKRWSRYGYLWTKALITEPVLVNLSAESIRSVL